MILLYEIWSFGIFFCIILLYYAIKHISSDPNEKLKRCIKRYEANCTEEGLQSKYHFKKSDRSKYNKKEKH